MFIREIEYISPFDAMEEATVNRILSEEEDTVNPPMYQSIIGIFLMIIGAVCTNLGNNLMSLGHSQQREIDHYKAKQELKKQKSGLSVDSIDSEDRVKIRTKEKITKKAKDEILDSPVDLCEKIKAHQTHQPLVDEPSDLTNSSTVLEMESTSRPRTNSLGIIIDQDRDPLPSLSRIVHPCLPGKNLPNQLDRLVEKGEELLGVKASKTSILGRLDAVGKVSPDGSGISCGLGSNDRTKEESLGGYGKAEKAGQSLDLEESFGSVGSSNNEYKLANGIENDDEAPPEKTWWFIGMCTFVFGALVVFLSFGFAAQSLLAALESVQFVSNVFFAKYIHKEEITRRIVVSTLMIITGNVFVVAFASHSSHRLTAAHIAETYTHNIAFHVWMGISTVLFFVCYFIWRRYSTGRLERNEKYWNHNHVESSCFIAYMALIGSQAVLHSKNLSMIMQHCIQGENQLKSNFSIVVWVELAVWLLTAYLYCGLINTGLNLYPPAFFIPVQAVFFALFTIICGGIYFYEFNFNVLQTIMFSLGCFLIFTGVWALAPDRIELERYVIPQTSRVLAVDTDDTLNETTNKIVENVKKSRADEELTPRIGVGYGAGLILTPRDDVMTGVQGVGGKYTNMDSDNSTVPTTSLELDSSPAGSKYNLQKIDPVINLTNRPGTEGTMQTWTSDDRSSVTEGHRTA